MGHDNVKRWFLFVWLLIGLVGFIRAQEELEGIVIEELDEDAALYQAGARVGDQFTHWERLPNEFNPDGEKGKIGDPFDWWFVAKNQAPRGRVILHGIREAQCIKILVDNDYWSSAVHPVFYGEKLSHYLRGKELIEKKMLNEGIDLWNTLSKGSLRSWITLKIAITWKEGNQFENSINAFEIAQNFSLNDRQTAVILCELGNIYIQQELWMKSLNKFKEVINVLNCIDEVELAKVAAYNGMIIAYFHLNEIDSVKEIGLMIFNIYNEKACDSVFLSVAAQNISIYYEEYYHYDLAESLLYESLDIQCKKTPYGLVLIKTLNSLGALKNRLGKHFEAQTFLEEGLNIQEIKKYKDIVESNLLNNMGNALMKTGELDLARKSYLKSIDVTLNINPDSLVLASSFNNLGRLESSIGNLSDSEIFYSKACDIVEKTRPNSIYYSALLNNLASIAMRMGHLMKAEELLTHAIAIKSKKNPEDRGLSYSYRGLSNLATKLNDIPNAILWAEKALAVDSKVPGSSGLATTLATLGKLSFLSGNIKDSECYYEQALAILEKNGALDLRYYSMKSNYLILLIEPGRFRDVISELDRIIDKELAVNANNPNLAVSYINKGRLCEAVEKFEEAIIYYEKALYILNNSKINNEYTVTIFAKLANFYKNHVDHRAAEQFFELGIDSIDEQFVSLDNFISTKKISFNDQFQYFYNNYVEYLLERERKAKAFQVLERFRARVLRDTISKRDITLSDRTTIALDLERKRLANLIEQTQYNIFFDSNSSKKSLSNLHHLQFLYNQNRQKILKHAPKLGHVRYPSPLNLTDVQNNLDPETLLISYITLNSKTIIFTLGKNPEPTIHLIPKGKNEINEQLNKWHQMATAPTLNERSRQIMNNISFNLYQQLVEPIKAEIEGAKRLVIIPDGPLWYLPFGALQTSEMGLPRRYLIEDIPITTVASASLYSELKARPKRPLKRIAAMGDAVYPGEQAGYRDLNRAVAVLKGKDSFLSPDLTNEETGYDFRTRALFKRMPANRLGRIPNTAKEVNAIANLFGSSKVDTYLRERANEANLKNIGKDVDIVHIAAHGMVNNQRPVDSALILTVNDDFKEGEENGILFAWEIFENVRLDADLVVLSACDSGLGKNSGGEGLIGLTRAFQYAGARSIIASYWGVEDESTAALFARFYKYLKEGKPKIEALQLAQIDMIRQPLEVERPAFFGLFNRKFKRDVSHPYYWAAFQLIGPWD